jgi:hypothetical protein
MENSKCSPASEQATPEPTMQLGLGFWGSKTLLSEVEIGLFTELAEGPSTSKRYPNVLCCSSPGSTTAAKG